jgi:hypothetical protein
MYIRLRTFNDLYSKDSKQWRYFTYCREADDWSLKKEKKDWEGENLPSIKHATLRWLVRTLVYVSDWDAKSYHLIFLEVLKAAQSNGEGYALALSDEGIAIGIEHEYFDSVQEILRQQRGLIEKLFSIPLRQTLLSENFELTEKVRECASEAYEMEKSYYRLYDPIKVALRESGKVPFDSFNKFRDFCLAIEPKELKTVTARRRFLAMDIPRLLVENKRQEAFSRGKELMELYSHNHWLRVRFSNEFNRNSVDIAALAILLKEQQLGEKYLSILVDHFAKMDVSHEEKAPFLILAKARLFELCGNHEDFLVAANLFRSNKGSLMQNNDHNLVCWAIFFCAKAAMTLGDWKAANEMLVFLSQQPFSDRAILSANARIMHLLCLLEIETDREYLIHFSETASTFVSRNAKDASCLRVISSGIRHALLSKGWSTSILELAERLSMELKKSEMQSEYNYFDYPAFLLSFTLVPKSHQ